MYREAGGPSVSFFDWQRYSQGIQRELPFALPESYLGHGRNHPQQRQFAFFNSLSTVTGKRPTEKYEIFGPIFRPWTFKIRQNGQDCGLISKRWAGLRKEAFTDADVFGIQFPPGISHDLKAVFLGAVFLIDFAHFEHGN